MPDISMLLLLSRGGKMDRVERICRMKSLESIKGEILLLLLSLLLGCCSSGQFEVRKRSHGVKKRARRRLAQCKIYISFFRRRRSSWKGSLYPLLMTPLSPLPCSSSSRIIVEPSSFFPTPFYFIASAPKSWRW